LISQELINQSGNMSRHVGAQVQNLRLLEERRDLIIDAAIRVFREKGFHVATTRDVATAAGVTQSNLYNYIRSKDDILYMVCDHLVSLYSEAVEDVVARVGDPHSRLVESVRAVISVMCEHKEELVLLYNDAHSLQKDDRRLVLSMISGFIKLFQDLIVDYEAAYGPTRLGSRRLAANLLSFVPAVMALRSWDLSGHVDSAEARQDLLDFILGGLGVPPVPPCRKDPAAPRSGPP